MGAGISLATANLRSRIAVNPLVSIHPIVRVHPETSERALFVHPGFTSHIVDVSPQESKLLLELFFNQIIMGKAGQKAFNIGIKKPYLLPSASSIAALPKGLVNTGFSRPNHHSRKSPECAATATG